MPAPATELRVPSPATALAAQLEQFNARLEEQRATNFRNEVERRVHLGRRFKGDPILQAVAMQLLAQDPVTFVNDWCWTNDPRNTGTSVPTDMPFALRPRQVEFIHWLETREEKQEYGLVEKSRDEGLTWLICAYMLHHWLFIPGFSGALGSRKQELVDKLGDLDTIFEKIRYLLERLPAWMKPAGFNNRLHNLHLRLINPSNGARITGEGGDNMGRGGRNSLYYIDEWAFVDRAEKVNAAVSNNSNVVIKGSTPAGVGNVMYEERFSDRFEVFTFHWRDNPAKNQFIMANGKKYFPWYETMRARLDPVSFAQEVDISYTASADNIVIPAEWVQAAINLELEPGNVTASGLDVAGSGKDGTVYAHRKGGLVTRVVPITVGEEQQSSAAKDLCLEDETSVLIYDRLGVGSNITATLKRDERNLPFRVVGVSNADTPSDRIFEDQPKVKASERFANAAAENWWALRLRFQRTYQVVNGLAEHPDEDLISIPNDAVTIAQLSQATFDKNSKDKIRVDKRGGGTKSPDRAEAILYAFASIPTPRRRTWGRN